MLALASRTQLAHPVLVHYRLPVLRWREERRLTLTLPSALLCLLWCRHSFEGEESEEKRRRSSFLTVNNIALLLPCVEALEHGAEDALANRA